MQKILFTFDGGLGDFLLAMSAVRALAITNPEIKIGIDVEDEELRQLAKHAWFVSGVDNPDQVIELVADIDVCKEVELSNRRKKKLEVDLQIHKTAEENGVSVDKVAKPEDYHVLQSDQPTWHKLMGYEYGICNATGLKVAAGDIYPYLPSIPGIKERTNKLLHNKRKEIKPSLPFVVISDKAAFEEVEVHIPYPNNWGAVVVEEDSVSYIDIIGLISNLRCKAVFGKPSTGITYLGWAGRLPLIVEGVTAPETSYWEVSRISSVIPINLKAPGVGTAFTSTINAAYKTRFGTHTQ